MLAEKLREYADRTTGYVYADEVAVLREAADDLDRLREALANVADWNADLAQRFGNVGVREYAESVLRPASDKPSITPHKRPEGQTQA